MSLETLRRRYDELLKQLHDSQQSQELQPVVTLEEFFDDNPNVTASFASNLPDHPGEAALFDLFKQIRAKPEVQGLWVHVIQMEIEDENNLTEFDWGYSDALVMMTSESAETVKAWFYEYWPDDIQEIDYTSLSVTYDLPEPLPDYHFYLVWWD